MSEIVSPYFPFTKASQLTVFTLTGLFKCKPLEAPANGYIVGKNFHVGGCVKFACNPGCMLYGSTIRVCNSHGKWSGTAPTCEYTGLPVVKDGRETLSEEI